MINTLRLLLEDSFRESVNNCSRDPEVFSCCGTFSMGSLVVDDDAQEVMET